MKPYRIRAHCAYCKSKLGATVYLCRDRKFTCSRFCHGAHERELDEQTLEIPSFTDDVAPRER